MAAAHRRRRSGATGAVSLLVLGLMAATARAGAVPAAPAAASASAAGGWWGRGLGAKRGGGEEGVREAVQGESLLAALGKASKKEGPGLCVAPVLFVGGKDDATARAVAEELFESLPSGGSASVQVTVAPFGDGDEEKQAVAVVAAYAAEEDVASGAFARVAREASLGFAVANDVVYAVPLPDVLRGELRGLSLLQAALEQLLTFQDKGLVDAEAAPRKALHVVVTDVDEEEAGELGLARAIEAQVSALWQRVIKPGAAGAAGAAAAEEKAEGEGEGEEEEKEQRGVPEWAEQLSLNVVCLPSKAYAAKAHGAALAGLKAALEAKWAKDDEGAFVPARELEAALAAMAPVSKEMLAGAAAVPKADSVVAAYYLDKLAARYAGQFRQDSRQLLEELNQAGLDEDFGKTFSELIDKYLADFHQEVYGQDAGPIRLSLQGLDGGAVGGVVRQKKEALRKALLGIAEEGYARQLVFLRQMAQEEFRKGISTLKYQWELIPGFAKAIKAARSLFQERAGKLACARSGARWRQLADRELRALTKVLETQADDVIERTRAGGGFVPTKLRRPVGVQINWLGANFFHFLRDSSCDPLSIRTDSGVALWETLGEQWISRDGKDQRVSARYRAVYGSDIDPMVMDYLLTNPKGVGLNDRDPRLKFGWNRRLAYELIRNHDDLTFQVPHAKAIASY